MEITINIPKNTYEVPTEIREDVVQKICEAFLNKSCWSIFHPFSQGCYRRATLFVQARNGKGVGFSNRADFLGKEGIKVRGCEIAAAFKALRDAGYHMYRYYEYREWMGYKVDEKPYVEGAVEVSDFTDFID